MLATAGPHGSYLGPQPCGDDRISFGQELPYPRSAHDNMMDESAERPEERAGTERRCLYLYWVALYNGLVLDFKPMCELTCSVLKVQSKIKSCFMHDLRVNECHCCQETVFQLY